MDENQLWAQLELKNKPFCDLLDLVLESETTGENEGEDELGLDTVASLEDDEEYSDSSDVTDESSSEDGSLSSGGDSTTQLRASDSEAEPLQGQGDFGLDDGFFDLNAFNTETEEAEARVVSSGHLGDEDDNSDDEMSVDLFAPMDNLDHFDEGDLENNNSGGSSCVYFLLFGYVNVCNRSLLQRLF